MNSKVCILMVAVGVMIAQQSQAQGDSVLFSAMDEMGQKYLEMETKTNEILAKMTEDLKAKAMDYKEPLKKLMKGLKKISKQNSDNIGMIMMSMNKVYKSIEDSFKKFYESLN